MKTRRLISMLVVCFLTFAPITLQAQTGTEHPADESLAYSGWCRYMDDLKAQRVLLGWRSLLDTGGILLGSVAFIFEMMLPTPNLTRAVLSAAFCFAGSIDLFAYTLPRHGTVAYKMMLFQKTGADRMWFWPCNSTKQN